MKQLSLILSIIAIGLSATVLVIHFKQPPQQKVVQPAAGATTGNGFKIAYFELDSLQNNYQYFKDALDILKTKEQAMNNEMAYCEKSYKKKIAEWQQKGNNMSQAEAESVNREYQQMQQDLQGRKQQLEQGMNDEMNNTRKKIRERLESYLKEYNKDKNYAYILSDFPEGIFYKDTAYNITNDLIKGLNESYKKKN